LEAQMRILAVIGALAIVVGISAAVFFFGGFYNVAGTVEDPAIVRWALIHVRTASIDRHAQDRPPTSINDSASVQAGAKAFAAQGCAHCHGAPGVNWAKYSEGLHPDPPDLKEIVDHRSPSQLFWVVKNGINMTGMPSFALAGAKDDEIWFHRRLPEKIARHFRGRLQGVDRAPGGRANASSSADAAGRRARA
jgi:mono/diheme cytochrome c family protein